MNNGHAIRIAAALVAAGIICNTVAEVDTAPAVKALDETIKALEKQRDELAKDLSKRIKADAKKGVNQDMLMRLDEGADQEEAHFIMRRRGGKFIDSYAIVPIWRQEDFHEIFKWHHRGRNDKITRDIFRNDLDANALSIRDGLIRGDLSAVFKLDKTKEDLFPPGTPRRWKTGQTWTALERMAMVNHEEKQVQTYKVDAKLLEDVYDFSLSLPNAILKKKVLEVQFQVPAQPWIRGEAWATDWNCGYHSLDASAMTFENGVLEGPLMVALNPDAWYPKRPQYMVYKIKAKLDGRKITGTYESEGDMESCAGPLHGEAGPFFAGTYDASGDFGDYHSMLYGRVMPAREDVSDLLIDDMQKPEGMDPVQVRANYANTLYNEIRALRLATEQYPLPIETALATTDNPAPVWEAMDEKAAASAIAYARELRARLATADKVKLDDVVIGSPKLADKTFGPFGIVAPLETAKTNVYVMPVVGEDGPQKWAYVPVWQSIRAIASVDTLDNNTEKLPEIVPVAGMAIEASMRKFRFGKKEKVPERILESWKPVPAPRGRAGIKYTGRGTGGAVAYFKTTLRSDSKQDVWVSMRAESQGKLWINGRLVWIGEEWKHRKQDDLQAIFKIALEKGDNELLVRVREHRRDTVLRAHFCLQGKPAEGSRSESVEIADNKKIFNVMGNYDGYFPNAQGVPLAWDTEKGINVAYKVKLPGHSRSDAVAANGRLFVACAVDKDVMLVCLDQKNGKVLWQKSGWLPEGEYEGVRATIICNEEMAIIGFGAMLTAYDMKGNKKWQIASDLSRDRFHWGLAGNRLIVQSVKERVRDEHICTAYDADTGKETWKITLPSQRPDRHVPVPRLLRLRNGKVTKDVVVVGSLEVLDPESGELLCPAPDADPVPGTHYIHDDILVYGARRRSVLVRYMLDPAGQVVARPMWRIHSDTKRDNEMRGVLVAGRYVALNGTVSEDTKGHSPAPYRQIAVYDLQTGLPIKRIKHAMYQAGLFGYEPVYVDGYVGMYNSGGGADGNAADYGQLVWVRLEPELNVVTRNKLPMGKTTFRGNPSLAGSSRPVFAGNRMFTVTADDLWCFGHTKGGERYEQEEAAKVMFKTLWDIPKSERYAKPKMFDRTPPYGSVPISRIENNIGLPHWMVAAPFPIPGDDADSVNAMLTALRPQPGDKIELAGTTRRFEALPQDAINCRYGYGGEYYLCGMGGTVAHVQKLIDVLSCTGGKKDMCGLIYTVVESSRPRVATLMVPSSGVEVWMGGMKLKPYATVQLDAGAYPLLARLRPDKMGKKPGRIQIAFKEIRDPRSARQTWLRKIVKAEDTVKAVARNLAGSPLGDKADKYLRELGEYKARIDEANLVRSILNGGTRSYEDARPPVPWERGANLKWRAPLPAAAVAAPVASGDNVYIALAPNTVAAYSRKDGAEIWKAEIDEAKGLSAPAVSREAIYVADSGGKLTKLRLDGSKAWSENVKGLADSPVCMIAGNMIVIQSGKALLGVSPDDGDLEWDVKTNATGLPLVTTFMGKPALATADGRILDPATGHKLVDGLPETGELSPHVSKGVLYAVAGRKGTLSAIELATDGSTRELWKENVGAQAQATPVALDNLLYVLANDKVCAVDRATGKVVAKTGLPGKIGNDTKLLLGGMHLFITGLGNGDSSVVLKPGTEPRIVWEYDVKGASQTPTFLGTGIYLVGDKALYAMAGKGPAKPEEYTPPPAIASPDDYKPGEGVPVVKFEDNVMPAKWLVSTAIEPMSLEIDFLEKIGGRKARPEVGQKVKHGKAKSEIAWHVMEVVPGHKSHFKHPQFSGGFDSVCVRTSADLSLDGSDRLSNRTLYFYTVINNKKDRYVELRILTPGGERWNGPEIFGARYFMNGPEVKPNDIVKMEKGLMPILIQVQFTTCNSGGKIWMAPRLTDHSIKYEGEVEEFETAKKVWDAYQKAEGERFVLE